MLQRLIAFSLKNAALICCSALILLGTTLYLMKEMSVDVFPELNAPTVTLLTESGGLSAEEVELFITFPMESAINGLPGLRRVRSSSTMGLSMIWAEFDWGVDIYRARQMVSERLSSVEDSIPEDSHIQMAPISSITGEIMLISLTGKNENFNGMEIRAYAEYDLRNQLLAIPGVAQVVIIGGYLPEYQIQIKQELLQIYNLSSEDIAKAVQQSHNLSSAGYLTHIEGLEIPIRQNGRVRFLEDIKNTIVTLHHGTPITLGDVTDIKLGKALRRGAASDNGKPAVVLSIQKAPGTNTLELTQNIDQLLNQIELNLPENMILNKNVFRQETFIQRSIHNVTQVLVEASIIIFIVLLLFLMNLRTTLITLISLPVSLSSTIFIMWATGLHFNVMTLGGLAVAIGILVDDSIIDVENVFRRLNENAQLPESERKSALKIIFNASNEIRSSVFFATLIICMVFVPLLFLQGLEGRFFKPLALTYMLSVSASLFVAMTLTPALCWLLLRNHHIKERKESLFSRLLKVLYLPCLQFCLKFKKSTLVFTLILSGLSLWLASTFGSSFLPKFNEGTYTVFLRMPPGTSLIESERIAMQIEKKLLLIAGVEHAVARSGRAEKDEHFEFTSNSEIEIRLSEQANPKQVLKEMDLLIESIPGVNANIGQPIEHRLSHVMSGTPAQVAINVYGEDLSILRQLAQKIESALKNLPGTRDINTNSGLLVQTLSIDFRLKDLARYGLSPVEAGSQIKRALYGDLVSVVHQGMQRYDLVVRLESSQRDSISDIQQLLLKGQNGALLRLHEVANIGYEQAPNLIFRQNSQRKIVISTNIKENYNLGDTVQSIQKAVNPIVHKHRYIVEYGGQFEAQQSASQMLLTLSLITGLIMLLLLQSALGSIRPAILVLFNLPLAMIGGILALYFTESQSPLSNFLSLFNARDQYISPVISIASIVGFITLFGIAVRNGILLVNHYQWIQKYQQKNLKEAVVQGSQERLIPVLMTAMSAMLGLIPLALKMGQPGSELLAPLAIVILGGLMSSTFLNMFVVPAGYLWFCRSYTKCKEIDEELLAVQ